MTTPYFEAEKHTILPVIKQFQARHGIENMVVVADAGMLSAANLAELDAAGLGFIVGSRVTKAPIDLASHFHWNGDGFDDGQLIDTVTPKTGANHDNDPAVRAEPVWDPDRHPTSWRAVWAFSRKRFVRDNTTLTAQENRARDVVAGAKAARPMFHRTRDAIEAHLTIVLTALAVARETQNRTGLAIRNVVRQLRPLRSATIEINGATQTLPPAIPTEQQALLDAIVRH